MDLSHSFELPVPFDEAWDAFNNLDGLVPCVPGATLLSAEADSFTGSVKVKLGPISMIYNGTGKFLERDKDAGRIVVEAKGKDKRGNGTAGANVVAQITATETGTAVQVTTDLSVTGKPAQFGRGVIQDVSDKLLGQFVDCFVKKLGPEAETAVETDGTAAPAVDPQEVAEAAVAGATADEPAHPAESRAAPATPRPIPRVNPPVAADTQPAELDLVSTVLPVLIRRYALPAALALVAVIAIRACLRR